MSDKDFNIVTLACFLGLLLLAFVEPASAFASGLDNPAPINILRNGRGRLDNLIQPGQVRHAIKRDQPVVLVDVRLSSSYQQYRIPGSINIPLSFIRTKRFLADKFVVLVDEGFQRESLIREIERLKLSGFSRVSILAGGITGWRRTGGDIEGDFVASGRSNMVSPATFFVEQSRSGLVVVNATGDDFKGAELITRAVSIPFNPDDRADFRKKVATALPLHSKSAMPDVLILAESADMYREIELLLADIGTNIFFLDGGLLAYRDFLKDQEKLQNHNTVTSGDKTCPVCPK